MKYVFQNFQPFLANGAFKLQKSANMTKNFFFAKFENNAEFYADFKNVEKNVKN
jgi:hypothetical protein